MQKALAASESVLMTVPDSYLVQGSDRWWIDELGIRLLPLPARMSLTQASRRYCKHR